MSKHDKKYLYHKRSEQSLSEFSDCFEEIGTLNNTYLIETKDNVTLAVILVRKIPVFKA